MILHFSSFFTFSPVPPLPWGLFGVWFVLSLQWGRERVRKKYRIEAEKRKRETKLHMAEI